MLTFQAGKIGVKEEHETKVVHFGHPSYQAARRRKESTIERKEVKRVRYN